MSRIACVMSILLLFVPIGAADAAPRNEAQAGQAAGVAGLTIEQRLQRIERILDSQGLVDMHVRLEQLQREVQTLRGEIELQSHTLKELKEQQRDLYIDLDRRLSQQERGGSRAPAAPAVPPQSTAPAPVPRGEAPKAGASSTAPSYDFAEEQQAYQKAFDLLRDLRYEQAVAAFRDFTKKYPDGRYAHIAQYWIAEANYAQRKFTQAIEDYQALINNYPRSPKLAEAKLKIGYSYYEMKDFANARKHLEELINRYPGSTESGQARNLLQKIKLNQ